MADALSWKPFVKPSILHHITQVLYDALLDEAMALNTGTVQDTFRWPNYLVDSDAVKRCPPSAKNSKCGEIDMNGIYVSDSSCSSFMKQRGIRSPRLA